MIHSVMIFNNAGKPRLMRFYSPTSPATPHTRTLFLNQVYDAVSVRSDTVCNFIDLGKGKGRQSARGDEDELKVVYRHYATLYFVFVVDKGESELGILDLIQVFVESLDRVFSNVCELDLIFHFPEVHLLLSCIITAGLVLDTSIESIAKTYAELIKARNGGTTSKPHSSINGSASGIGVGPLGGLGALGAGWDKLVGFRGKSGK